MVHFLISVAAGYCCRRVLFNKSLDCGNAKISADVLIRGCTPGRRTSLARGVKQRLRVERKPPDSLAMRSCKMLRNSEQTSLEGSTGRGKKGDVSQIKVNLNFTFILICEKIRNSYVIEWRA